MRDEKKQRNQSTEKKKQQYFVSEKSYNNFVAVLFWVLCWPIINTQFQRGMLE